MQNIPYFKTKYNFLENSFFPSYRMESSWSKYKKLNQWKLDHLRIVFLTSIILKELNWWWDCGSL